MRSKGFVSIIFLILFIQIVSFVSVCLYRVYLSSVIVDNMKQVNLQISREAALISILNCYINEGQSTSHIIEVADVSYEVIYSYPQIEVVQLSNGETMIFHVDEQNQRVTNIEYR